MLKKTVMLCASLLSLAVQATSLEIELEIPRLNVAEYHRPYVALWLETADGRHAGDLAVWYDLAMPNNKGQEWLKDMRQWWRRSGRSLVLPVDGLTGATRAPGNHRLAFAADHAVLAALPAGDYRLMVEAAREVGGRELLSLPLSWPVGAAGQQRASGKSELGRVQLQLQP